MADVLPTCTTRELRGRILINGQWNVPCYCMNCHKQFGYCFEPQPGSGYVGFLCEKCAETWSPLVGTMIVPDEVHAARCKAEMQATYGRELTALEIVRVLDDGTAPLAKLAAEWRESTP